MSSYYIKSTEDAIAIPHPATHIIPHHLQGSNKKGKIKMKTISKHVNAYDMENCHSEFPKG
jgi:hypothetical protein